MAHSLNNRDSFPSTFFTPYLSVTFGLKLGAKLFNRMTALFYNQTHRFPFLHLSYKLQHFIIPDLECFVKLSFVKAGLNFTALELTNLSCLTVVVLCANLFL